MQKPFISHIFYYFHWKKVLRVIGLKPVSRKKIWSIDTDPEYLVICWTYLLIFSVWLLKMLESLDWIFLWKKSYDQPRQHIKIRDVTLPTKVCLVKAMVFPVVMYGCDSWTMKTGEHWRIDTSELWCWRRLLRVSWTVRRPNQSILEEISLGCSLEGLVLKLKLQYFDYWMLRADSFAKTLMLGKIEKRTTEDEMVGRHHWWHHWLNGHEFD